MIHVVQAIHDKSGDYARHLCVAMESYLSNTKSEICVHILHDNTLTERNKEIIKALAAKHQAGIRFYEIDIPNLEGVDMDKLTKEFSVGTLFRLKLPDVLQDIDRVIYLDLDIVCTLDLQELWDVDISGYPLAAMPEYGMEVLVQSNASLREFYGKVPIVNARYFNSGIMVWDMDMIRQSHDLFREAMDYFTAHPDTPYADQDALNYIFQSEYKQIDQRFNFRSEQLSMKNGITQEELAELYGGKLWHFAGFKPWAFLLYRPFELYWQYFAQTEWGNTPQKLWDWMEIMARTLTIPHIEGEEIKTVTIAGAERQKIVFQNIMKSKGIVVKFVEGPAKEAEDGKSR